MIPLQLLGWIPLHVLEIEDSSEFFVPAEVDDLQHQFLTPEQELLIIHSLGQVHEEPASFDHMAGVHQSSLIAIYKLSIWRHIFHHNPELFLVEVFLECLDQCLGEFVNLVFAKNMLTFDSQIAQNHRQRKVLHISSSGVTFAVAALPVVLSFQDIGKYILDILFVLIRWSNLVKSGKSHACKTVTEYVVGLNQWLTLLVKGEVVVSILIMTKFLQKISAMLGHFQPIWILLHLVVENTEAPGLSPLKPDKFVSIIYVSKLIQLGEESTIFGVFGVFLPERNHVF